MKLPLQIVLVLFAIAAGIGTVVRREFLKSQSFSVSPLERTIGCKTSSVVNEIKHPITTSLTAKECRTMRCTKVGGGCTLPVESTFRQLRECERSVHEIVNA